MDVEESNIKSGVKGSVKIAAAIAAGVPRYPLVWADSDHE